MKPRHFIPIAFCLLFTISTLAAQAPPLPIGAIQGAGDVSPYLNRFVNFSGVVVGRYEDENTRGDVYYTLFVQNAPAEADGDPATSDGIAVFLGRESRRDIAIGQRVTAGGKVTEYYGLTEIDDRGLFITPDAIEPLPAAALIDPPADMAEMAAYFEALEGMRVAYDGAVVVAGPTHEGCGFAVIGETAAVESLPALRRADDDPVGRVVPVLYPSDLNCDDIPQVKTGDRLTGMAGALTYNFDQFKIVIDSAGQLTIEAAEMPAVAPLPALDLRQFAVATLNVEDLFDAARDTAEEGEPVPSEEEIAARRAKLAHVVSQQLHCPALLALQEVEHDSLLAALSADLAEPCGFVYQVSHLETPDARGIDNALLSDPGRMVVTDVALRQACSPVPTDIVDPSIACEAGQEPLFGRPPLQVEVRIDGEPYTIWVNHFKSKRGGETETGLERIHQAVYLNGLAAELLADDPAARVIALGDFNDTELSPVLALLTDTGQGGVFTNALSAVPEAERYSYNFGGVVELIDAILVSPAAAEDVADAAILHVNADYPVGWRLDTSPERLPWRVSDHDIPVVVFGRLPATPMPEATATTTTDGRPATAEPAAVTTTASQPPTAEHEVSSVAQLATAEPAANTVSISETSPAMQRGRIFWPALLLGVALVALVGFVLIRSRR